MNDELIRLVCDLIEFKTVKENSSELDKCINYCKKYFATDDFVIQEFSQNNKPSIIVSYADNPTKHFKLLLNGHIDVVEAEKEQFNPLVKNGKIYGRGAVDMKGGVGAFMYLMNVFAKEKPDMALMIVSDEEIGGADGSGYLIEQGYTADFAIASEPNQPDKDSLDIVVKEKGLIWLKLTANGIACHGSRPWLGDNALDKLLRTYAALRRLFPDTQPDDRWKPTMNLGKISGGNSPNRVPDAAEMFLDIRYTEAMNVQDFLSGLNNLKEDGVSIEVIDTAPMLINKRFDEIQTLQKVAEKIQGRKSSLREEHGASDMRYLSEKGIPSIIFGPSGANHHGANEYVIIQSMELLIDIMEAYIEEKLIPK